MHALEFPVCVFDLKTGVLCSKCEKKVRDGEVTTGDIEVMRLLLDLEKKFSQISHLVYKKSLAVGGYLFVFFGDKTFSTISASVRDELKKALEEKTGLKAKLVELSKDLNVFLQNLVAPARILTVNKVWLPDQTTELKVVVDDERSMGVPASVLSEMARNILNLSISFDFQKKGRQPHYRFSR